MVNVKSNYDDIITIVKQIIAKFTQKKIIKLYTKIGNFAIDYREVWLYLVAT